MLTRSYIKYCQELMEHRERGTLPENLDKLLKYAISQHLLYVMTKEYRDIDKKWYRGEVDKFRSELYKANSRIRELEEELIKDEHV